MTRVSLFLAAQETMIFLLKRWKILIQGIVMLVDGWKIIVVYPHFISIYQPLCITFMYKPW